ARYFKVPVQQESTASAADSAQGQAVTTIRATVGTPAGAEQPAIASSAAQGRHTSAGANPEIPAPAGVTAVFRQLETPLTMSVASIAPAREIRHETTVNLPLP